MPELPEVETIRQSLLPVLLGQEIQQVFIYQPVVLASQNIEEFLALTGFIIVDIKRRGKYLIFYLQKGEERFCLVAHMRMTGKLLWHTQPQPLEKHSHVEFRFVAGGQLIFQDVRRFGRLWLVKPAELNCVSGLRDLALEPLDIAFTLEYWQEKLSRHPKAMIKAVLLDQHVVAGLGNIYADEVLFAAKVHPQRPAGTLTKGEQKDLWQAMQDVLQQAIALRGTSFRDYVDGNQEKGSYQDFLQCFMREGKPCPRCGALIQRMKVVGRSSYFCPHCQQKP